MPSFNDFIENYLDDETIIRIVERAQAKSNQAILQIDKENPLSILGNQVMAISFTISVELLREYHRWLSEYPS